MIHKVLEKTRNEGRDQKKKKRNFGGIKRKEKERKGEKRSNCSIMYLCIST